MTRNAHPPLMAHPGWTLAIPFKEAKYFRTPSESIGNNFSPNANRLRLQEVQRPSKRSRKSPGSEASSLSKSLTSVPTKSSGIVHLYSLFVIRSLNTFIYNFDIDLINMY